jgi:hypothetical protein
VREVIFGVVVLVLGLVLVIFPMLVAHNTVRQQSLLLETVLGECEVEVGASVVFLGGTIVCLLGYCTWRESGRWRTPSKL